MDIVAAARQFAIPFQVVGRHFLGGSMMTLKQLIDLLIQGLIFQHKALVFLYPAYVAWIV
jgi:hypothetical protein